MDTHTSKGPSVAAAEEQTPEIPSSGICHNLTRRSSAPVTSRLSWKGEKSKSVTKPAREGDKSCFSQRGGDE